MKPLLLVACHLVMLLACVAAGCTREPSSPPRTRSSMQPPSDAVVERLRARNATRFAVADFLKPRMDASSPIDPYLAPLFHFEAPHDAPLCRVLVDGDGAPRLDATRPTLYYADHRVALDDRERRQLTFVWFRRAAPPRAQGVRLTFDAGGFPAIAEVLDDESGARLAYVSETLEQSAARAYGGPLPGRAYALEAAPDVASGGGDALVVAGTIDAGPAPMGPYVYQARDAHDVVTIRCRCSSSQVDAIGQAIDYELAPLEMLAGAWPSAGQPRFAPYDVLERSLRLPPEM
ncbi:MAG: hypothetical protein ACYTG2_10065 [Planctomycetota bacterium]